MEINDKKFNRTRKVIYFFISVILAGFLIMLADTIIWDLSSTVSSPQYEDFVNNEEEKKYSSAYKEFNNEIDALNEVQNNIYKLIETAKENKEAEQQSFENWSKARGTLGTPEQDPEVLKRLRKVDEYQLIVQSWQIKYDSISTLKEKIYAKQAVLNEEHSKETEISNKAYYSALNNYDLKVFLVRLLFAAPILVLGIYLFVKKRRHKLSPLFMGFSLFSVYVFFVGLVPYLPSFGGYVRYIVGVLLTIGLGYYAIKQLRMYQERRKAELKQSTEERAKKMESETAEKSFNNHVCPSCGKDFLLKNWETINSPENLQTVRPLIPSSFCRYCGMQLIKQCSNCHQENYAHLPFCVKCGKKL